MDYGRIRVERSHGFSVWLPDVTTTPARADVAWGIEEGDVDVSVRDKSALGVVNYGMTLSEFGAIALLNALRSWSERKAATENEPGVALPEGR